MYRSVFAVCLFVASFAPVDIHAASKEVFDLTATSAEEFRQQADALRNEMKAGGKYASVAPSDKEKIGKQLEVLQELYDDRAAGKRFGKKDEVRLVNASEEINGLLSGDTDDRLVCQQERRLGSNRTERVCLTVAERRELREEAAKDLRNQRTAPFTN